MKWTPTVDGAPGTIRTSDPQIRSLAHPVDGSRLPCKPRSEACIGDQSVRPCIANRSAWQTSLGDDPAALAGMGGDHHRRPDSGRPGSCSALPAEVGSSPMIELVIDPAGKAGLFVGRVGNRSSCEADSLSSMVPECCWPADTIGRLPTTCGTRTPPRYRSSRRPSVALRG